MFDEILDTISALFTIFIIILIVCIFVIIIKTVDDVQKTKERVQKEQKAHQEFINQVISDTKKFPTNILLAQRDEVLQAYNELYDCKQRGLRKTKEMLLFFRVGDEIGCSMDLKTSYAVLQILDEELKRRQG